MNDRWVKLPCGLDGCFCPVNPKKDAECKVIYIQLLVDASWDDGPLLKRGQVLVKWKSLAEKLPWFDVETIRRRVKILIQSGYVKKNRTSKWDGDGSILTLCHYNKQPDLLIVQQDKEVRQKRSKNRQQIDSKPTTIVTTLVTTHDDFNELSLLDLSDIKNKTDNTCDNTCDNTQKENRQPTNYKELRTKKIYNTPATGADRADDFLSAWNSTVKGRIAKIKKLNPTRIKKIKSFLVDSTFEDFQKITNAIIRSPWHNGSGSEWVTDFDWAFSAKALTLVEKSEHTVNHKQPNGMKILT